jgi:hypothetical protein
LRSVDETRRESSGLIGGGSPPVQRSNDAKKGDTSGIHQIVIRLPTVFALQSPIVVAHSTVVG